MEFALDINEITTDELAKLFHVKPTSVRGRLCTEGSYYGLRPVKLPTGRLLWPKDQALKLKEDMLAGRGVAA